MAADIDTRGTRHRCTFPAIETSDIGALYVSLSAQQSAEIVASNQVVVVAVRKQENKINIDKKGRCVDSDLASKPFEREAFEIDFSVPSCMRSCSYPINREIK